MPRSPWYGAERPKFLGPLEADYPPWLRGEAPADYGFDPLALSREPAAFERNFELELLHARWAMLGALGALVPGAPALPLSSLRNSACTSGSQLMRCFWS